MELYTLNPLDLRRQEVFDRFESLIWTERFTSAGDFELVTHSDNKSRSLLKPGTLVTVNNSYRVGRIEEVEDKDDSEGRSLISIKGPHLESVLGDRTSRSVGASGGDKTPWYITGLTAPNVVRHIFNTICVNNTSIPEDLIPLYTSGSLFPAGSIAETTEVPVNARTPAANYSPANTDAYSVPTDSLYSIFTSLADTYGFGFRLYRGLDTGQLFFEVYMGDDRTTKQSTFAPVIFSAGNDTLAGSTYLTSLSGSKNVAYVYHKQTSLSVALNGVDPSAYKGFDRKVLAVDANSLDSSLTMAAGTLEPAMIKLGKEALLNAQPIQAIDGQIPENSQYRYGLEYNLGDLVEMRDEEGKTAFMRVTEHIYASDDQGDRSYPTVSINQFVVPGSWDAFDISTTWNTVNPALTWNTV